MNGRTIAQVLLVVLLIGGAIGLGVTAYDAGVANGLAQHGDVAVAPGGYPVGPYAGWGYGYGFGHGFGFFGFLGGLLFLFLFIGLIRAAFGAGRGWGPRHGRGWYGGGWRDEAGRSWEDRAREVHDAWHRDHPDTPDRPTGPSAS